MGKTVRWFRKLLGGKTVVEPNSKPAKEKKGWRFLRSLHNRRELVADDGNEENSVGRKHAIAPAEAEAAAAIAGGRGRTVPAYCSGKREDAAAVKIQAAFRCHLVSILLFQDTLSIPRKLVFAKPVWMWRIEFVVECGDSLFLHLHFLCFIQSDPELQEMPPYLNLQLLLSFSFFFFNFSLQLLLFKRENFRF